MTKICLSHNLHRCVANEKCDGLLQVRGAELICEDTSLKCCYNSSLTETIMEIENSSPKSSEIDSGDYYDQSEEYCSAYEDEGYRFVLCNPGKSFSYTDYRKVAMQ